MNNDILNKKIFIVTAVIFASTVLFCGYVFYSINAPLDLKANKKNVAIEITLPVLEWTKYTSLTKNIGQVLGIKTTRKGVKRLSYPVEKPSPGETQMVYIE